MKAQYQYAELRTLTPELGVFVITGHLDDVEAAGRYFHTKRVTESTFDRMAYGMPRRRSLAWF